MNSMQVKYKLKNIVKNKNLDFNIVLKFYVFDRFIIRLSKSKYKDNFIIKGGFLLSTLFGLENRSTMDIDSAITNAEFTKQNILKMVEGIINIDLDDNIKFLINGIEPIRSEDEYGGYRISLIFEFENIKELMKLDIATVDPITPRELELNYTTMLEEENVKVWSYNIETVLAEKIETIFSKVELSSRMKDYYDIYLIYNKDWKEINKLNLKNAIEKTFEKRKFTKDLITTFNVIKSSSVLRTRWNAYSKKYKYANNISYEDIVMCLEDIINILELISI